MNWNYNVWLSLLCLYLFTVSLALYEHANDNHSPAIWSPLVICDVGAVAAGRRGNDKNIPYAWLICLFMKHVTSHQKWESLVNRAMAESTTVFRLADYFTRSDEAFMLVVLCAKGPGWSAELKEKKEAAWEWAVVSISVVLWLLLV